MKRTIISIVLVVTMIVTMTGSAFANDTSYENQAFTVMQLVKGINDAGYDIEIESQSDSKIEYCMDVFVNGANISSENVVEELDDGTIRLECKEADNTDIVFFKADGSIIANGEKVIVETSGCNSINAYSDKYPVLKGKHYNVMTTACPYGSSSDYTQYYSNSSNSNIVFQQAIASFTVGALASILVGIVLTGVGMGAGATVVSSLISSGISSVIYYFSNNNPGARAMSSTTYVYTHKTKGAYVGSGLYVYKHVVSYYAYPNFTTYITSSTVYNKIQV